MASSSDIKQLADRLDIPYNNSWSDEDIFASIASQVGFDGYDYSESSKQKLYSILKDMDNAVNSNSDTDDYESLDDYGDEEEELEEEEEEPEQLDEDDLEEDEDEESDDEESDDEDDEEDSDDDSEDEDEDEVSEDEDSEEDNDDTEKSNEDGEESEQSQESEDTEDSEKQENTSEESNDNLAEDESVSKELDNQSNGESGEAPSEKGGSETDGESSSPSQDYQKGRSSQNSGGSGNGNNGFDNSQKNLEHSKRMKEGANPATPSSPVPKTPNPAAGGAGGAGAGAGKAASTGAKQAASGAGKAAATGAKAAGDFFATKVAPLIAAHPWILVVILVVIALIGILVVVLMSASDDDDNKPGAYGAGVCNYNLAGIVANGSVELNGIKVELVNCDAKPDNYKVLGTIDFEKYVLGTALAEIGENTADEAIKAQIIAVRNFALTRNRNMCPGNTDDCFYGYNPNTNVIRMRACEADQVYWDYTTDIYRANRGAISLYSPEANSSNGVLWKHALSEERKQEVEALAQAVKGKVLLDQNGMVMQTPYNSTTSDAFMDGAAAGKSYEELLSTVYGSTNINSAVCSSYGNIDYGDYDLTSKSDEIILREPLTSFLESKGTNINEFNNLIYENVKKAGYGTRAGVVASAVTLIAELGNKYNARIPYFWGGGHSGHIDLYANGTWGSSSCRTTANGHVYDRCGLDCSGFVPWAIYNGGYNLSARLAYDYQNMNGAQKVSLDASNAVVQPGDLLESRSHVVLVVGIDEVNKQYICAEASGWQYGVWFMRRSFNEKGYYGVKLDDFYNNPSNIRGG